MGTPLSEARTDKKKIKTHKTICLVIWLASVVIFLICAFDKGPKIISTDGRIDNYYEYSDESKCTITATLSKSADEGTIKVAFYDENGKFLEEKTETFYSWNMTGKNLEVDFYFIKGKVASYIVTDFSARSVPSWVITALLQFSFIPLIFLISALTLSCRVYDFNGNIITVYAGWFHHYLKVNGKVMDENNTIIGFSPIYLSTNLPDGTYLQATITTMNRVSFKINNVLYTVEIKNP